MKSQSANVVLTWSVTFLRYILFHSFSSPEAAILVVSGTDQDLWQGLKPEIRESRTSGFWAQPQKFETITVTVGYKNGQLLCSRVTLAPARGLGTRMSFIKLYKVAIKSCLLSCAFPQCCSFVTFYIQYLPTFPESDAWDFCIHTTQISEKFLTTSEHYWRCPDDFQTLPKMFRRLPNINEDSWRCSDNFRRLPNVVVQSSKLFACYLGLKRDI